MRSRKSYLTAISRKTLPTPTRWIMEKGWIIGHVLDYGCGKCHEVNNRHFDCDGYDPYYRPSGLPEGKYYATILCVYVLCTIPSERKRKQILCHIRSLLIPDGVAFIAVRADRPKNGWGFNKRGTYQGKIMDIPGTKLIRSNSQYRIFMLTDKSKI